MDVYYADYIMSSPFRHQYTGKVREYDFNGILWKEYSYKDGELHGDYNIYDVDGKITEIVTYVDGQLDSSFPIQEQTKIYENDNKKEIVDFHKLPTFDKVKERLKKYTGDPFIYFINISNHIFVLNDIGDSRTPMKYSGMKHDENMCMYILNFARIDEIININDLDEKVQMVMAKSLDIYNKDNNTVTYRIGCGESNIKAWKSLEPVFYNCLKSSKYFKYYFGEFYSYHDNGIVHEVQILNNGLIEGEVLTYNKNGDPYRISMYKNGIATQIEKLY